MFNPLQRRHAIVNPKKQNDASLAMVQYELNCLRQEQP